MSTRNPMALLALPAVVLAFAACDSGRLGSQPSDPSVSPGTVNLQLLLPSNRSFCEQIDTCAVADHFAFYTPSYTVLPTNTGWCPTTCSDQCVAPPCPLIPCGAGRGGAVTSLKTVWQGIYYEGSTCGAGIGCVRQRFAPSGRYLVKMCARPGTVVMGELGIEICVPAGEDECVTVPFVIPGPDVTATLSP